MNIKKAQAMRYMLKQVEKYAAKIDQEILAYFLQMSLGEFDRLISMHENAERTSK